MNEVTRPTPDLALETINLTREWGFPKEQGKVRDVFQVGEDILLLVATDRLSAFDRQVGVIPHRGQILNELSQWWFDQTADIIPNHMVRVLDPNVMEVRKYQRVDLEMIVRGYLTGSTDTSIWKRYEQGQRGFGSLTLPDNMHKNEQLPYVIVDPTSKASIGHDKNMNALEIVEAGLVTESEYAQLARLSRILFIRGQQLARRAGLILVDTKYEFGKDDEGNFVLIDEIHTPDSSRFWGGSTYEERLQKGQEPDIYDKEFARLWFIAQGYKGEGEPPKMPLDVIAEIQRRYIYSYEHLTGKPFVAPDGDPDSRIKANVRSWYQNLILDSFSSEEVS